MEKIKTIIFRGFRERRMKRGIAKNKRNLFFYISRRYFASSKMFNFDLIFRYCVRYYNEYFIIYSGKQFSFLEYVTELYLLKLLDFFFAALGIGTFETFIPSFVIRLVWRTSSTRRTSFKKFIFEASFHVQRIAIILFEILNSLQLYNNYII